MSVASEIARLQNAKASIKTAIENKGVTVGDIKLDAYSAKIDEISTGAEPTGTLEITENGTYDVKQKAYAKVAVPEPSGNIKITENGFHIIKQYSIAEVAVYPTLIAKTISANGTYNASDDNAYGYGSVSVNVPEKNLGTKTINANGDYNATDDNLDGYSNVSVSVPEKTLTTKTITANGTYNATDDNADGFSSVVVNVPSGGTPVKSNVYRVPTLEARDAITDMVEGDVCVVYESNISNVTVDSRFQTAIFPEVVVLDTAITGYVGVRYRAVDESIMFDCQGSLDSSRFNMDCFMGDNSIRIEYTSEDGITYTRTDTTGNPVDFGTEIKYDRPEMWNNAIGKFIQASSLNFDGIFQYKDNHWNYANINIPTTADYIYKDCKAYTNNGTVIGTLVSDPSITLDDMNAKVYSELSMLYNNLDEIIAPENSSNLYSDSSIYIIPSKINGKSLLNTSNVTNMSNMFYNCKSLITIPQLDTSKVTSMNRMFARCSSLTSIPELDTSKVTNMNEMFNSCSSLTSIPQLNTSNATSLFSMFGGCSKLTAIPQLNTSNVTDMGNVFYNCFSLTTIPQLDTSNVTRISRIFWGCDSLTNLGGFTNLGQAYSTTQSANYGNYTLDLSSCTKLTHDSLMNVINNLYDIANKGVMPQKLVLGSENLAKLTAEEIQIATDKGFEIS